MTAPEQQNAAVAPPPIAPRDRNTSSKKTKKQKTGRIREVTQRTQAPSKAVRDTISAAHGTLALGGLEHVANVPVAYPGVLGAVLTAAGVAWGSQRGEMGFGTAMGAGAGGWLLWSAFTTPWSVTSLASLAVAATGAGFWYRHVRGRLLRAACLKKQANDALAAAVNAPADTEASRYGWEEILQEAGCTGVAVESTKPLEQGASGFRLVGKVTDPKFGYDNLSTSLGAIERVADKRTEYPIRAGSIQLSRPKGGTASQFEMTVPTADIFGQPIPHPLNHEPRSIETPIEVATAADGSRLAVRHWESAHAMFSGMTDFGKSNLLNCHIYEWTRCTDATVWLMSGPDKAPKLLKPLLRPWLKGETANPPIDRFAATQREAMYMLWDAIQGMKHRANSGGIDDTGSKWKVTPDKPRLVIGIEEASDFLEDESKTKMPDGSKYSFGDLVRWLIRKARSEAINLLILTQGGTLDFFGSEGSGIKKQIVYRVAFRAQATSETNACLAGDTRDVDLGTLGKGEVYMEQLGSERPTLALADYIEEGDTPDEHVMNIAARMHHQYARELDAETAAAMPYYRERWTRDEQQEFLSSLLGVSVENITAPGGEQSQQHAPEGVDVPDTPADLDAMLSGLGEPDGSSDHARRMSDILARYESEVEEGEFTALTQSFNETPASRTLGDLDGETLRVVGVIQNITDNEMTADDLRARIATALDLEDNTETDRFVNGAVRDILGVDDLPAEVKRRRTRGNSKVYVWDLGAIKSAIADMGRGR